MQHQDAVRVFVVCLLLTIITFTLASVQRVFVKLSFFVHVSISISDSNLSLMAEVYERILLLKSGHMPCLPWSS